MHHMVKSCYTAADPPIKAHCFCLFRLQREYWSVWKTTQSNAAVFAKGLWEAGIHLCVVETLSAILQKHVHVNKQAVGKVPELSCSKRFRLRWVYIMIQMKIIRMRQMVIIR